MSRWPEDDRSIFERLAPFDGVALDPTDAGPREYEHPDPPPWKGRLSSGHPWNSPKAYRHLGPHP